MQRRRGHTLPLIGLSFPSLWRRSLQVSALTISCLRHLFWSVLLIIAVFLLSVGDHAGDKSGSKVAHTGVKLLPINRDGFGATGEE